MSLSTPRSETPKPTSGEVQSLFAAALSKPSRPGHILVLVGALVSAGIAGALLATEDGLPTRTSVALSLVLVVGLSWAAFAVWVLTRRRVLLGRHRVIAARMAVGFTTVFAVEVSVLAASGAHDRRWGAAVALAVGMLAIAIALLIRAQRRLNELTKRRDALSRQLGRGIVLAFLALGIPNSASNAQDSAAATIVPGTFSVGGQAVDADRGRFTVPANRSTRTASLALAFIRFKSTAAAPRSPIVFLAGGPGDAGTRAVGGMPIAMLDELRSIADVIAFDQRGTGLSEPLNRLCPPGEMLPRDRPADPALYSRTLSTRVEACLAKAKVDGVDVLGLTTAESADDLEALRRVLGAKKLSFLAGSYGTHLALATAARHPESVDRMILAGVEGLDDTFKLPSRVDDVVAAIARAKRPSLIEDVRTLQTRLKMEPARFTFPTGQVIVLGDWDLRRFVSEALDEVPKIDAMVAAVPQMLDGDFTALGRWALGYRIPKSLNVMNLAMDCASYASRDRLARIAREAETSLLGNAINFPLPDVCDVAGLPRLPESYRSAVPSNVEALLISGSFDGRTPVQNAVDLTRTMPRATSLVIDGAAHGLFREPAVTRAIVAFLQK